MIRFRRMFVPLARRNTSALACLQFVRAVASKRQARIRSRATRLLGLRNGFLDFFHHLGNVHDGTNLDAAASALAFGRNLTSPVNRLVEVLAVEDVVAAQLFLGLGERAIKSDRFAVL